MANVAPLLPWTADRQTPSDSQHQLHASLRRILTRSAWTANAKQSPRALSSLNRWKGRRRAAFWPTLGFPNLVLARTAKARKREERLKREIRAGPCAEPVCDTGRLRLTAGAGFSPIAKTPIPADRIDVFRSGPSVAIVSPNMINPRSFRRYEQHRSAPRRSGRGSSD